VATRSLPFERCVFVNCPFDGDFLPLPHVIAVRDPRLWLYRTHCS